MPMGEDPRHGILVALVVALVGLLLLIVAAFALAPVLVIVLGLMTYVVWWYVSKEGTSYLHHAQEHENRFWTMVAFCFSGALVFVHDSPVALGQRSPVLGFLFVAFFTYSIHSLDREAHRLRIGRDPKFRSTVESSLMIHSSVQDKCRRISVCLSKLDNRLVATNLNHMLWADMVKNLEREIVNILSDADTAELNYMLPKIGLGLLFYKVKDHYPTNMHRTRLLDLLALNRVSELNITSRALVLDGLQQMKLSAHRKSELYVRNVILKTQGDELSELKSLTDAKGDIHSIHKLVYQDIKDLGIREEVLKHIATQAKVQAAHMRLGTRKGSRRGEKAWRKILSDVDDTLTSSGGRYPAGVDRRYPRKSVYPGVLDFYRELDLGVNGPSEWPSEQLGNLVFLSARPHVYKDVSEAKSYAKFKKLQIEKGLYTSPTLLAGDIDTGRAMLLRGDMEPVAVKKFQNFAEYASIYPEFKHVFLGDNGQGDVLAAEMMAKRFPELLEAVYMQRVIPEDKTFGYKGSATRDRWRNANIKFFGDYVEAACHAYKRRLIQAVGLQRICQGAVQQFVDMKFETVLDREMQRRQINQSVWQANKLLQAADLEPNWLIRSVRAFDNMDAVLTPFGRGTVVNFRPEDGVYEVLLDWPQKAGNPHATAASLSRASAASRPSTVPATPVQLRPHSSSAQVASSPPSRPGALARPTSFPPPGLPSPPLASGPSALPPFAPAAPIALNPVIGNASASANAPAPAPAPASAAGTANAGAATVAPTAQADVSPERGPDAAGGRDVFRESRARPTAQTAMAAAAAEAPQPLVSAAASVAVVAAALMPSVMPDIGTNGAEEAAGGPAATAAGAGAGAGAAATRTTRTTGTLASGDGAGGRDAAGAAAEDSRATSNVAMPEGATGALVDTGSAGLGSEEHGSPERAGHTTSSPSRNEDMQLVPCLDGTWPPTDPGRAEDHPPRAQESAQATAAAAQAFATSNPGSMVVRAYLQLSSLRKAPPEPLVRRAKYRDATADDPKSTRRSNRISIFRGGNDAVGGNSRPSPTKTAIAEGAVVQTFMGPATVNKFRAEDAMCEVTLHRWVMGGNRRAVAILRASDVSVDAAATAAAAATVGKSPSLLGRTGKAISSLFKLSADLAVTPSTPVHAEPRVGDIVDTVFGPAAVTGVRGPQAAPAAGSSASRFRNTGRRSKSEGPSAYDSTAAGESGAEGILGMKRQPSPVLDGPLSSPSGPSAPPPVPHLGTDEAAPTEQQQQQQQQQQQRKKDNVPLASAASLSSPVTSPGVTSLLPPPPPPPPLVLSARERRRSSDLTEIFLAPTREPASRRRRSVSVTAVDDDGDSAPSSSIAGDDIGPGALGAQLTSKRAGVLLPGKLFTPTPTPKRGPRPPSPATAVGSGRMSTTPGRMFADSEGDNYDASSPLGVQILEEGAKGKGRRHGAAPAHTVLYEVAFMKWRLGGNTPVHAVLNRSSIWAEWERRPSICTKREERGVVRRKKSTRPSSFFGFMSMVGGLGGGGGGGASVKVISPAGSPRSRSKAPKIPVRPAAAVPLHSCEFSKGSIVATTIFGPALVIDFRPADGIYQVSLLRWGMRTGGLASAYLTRSAILSSLASPGAAVRTIMGLGTVETCREDGVVVVRLGRGDTTSAGDGAVSADSASGPRGAEMFLQLSAILGSAKANLGERVHTALGPGIVRSYSAGSDAYTVDLGWGLLHSPHGSAIRERRTATALNLLSTRSSVGIGRLFNWRLF